MEKEEYIKAIEELNKEQIQFYNSEEYKKYRNKRHLRKLFRNREYQEIYLTMLKKLEKKKRKKKLKSREIYPITEYITNLENKKKVVYTCVLKNYDKVYSPILTTENTEYIIFSDDKDIVKGVHSWQFRPIPEKVRKLCDNKDILINRYIKMHAKELFPDYDFALYIDGSIRIISDITSVLKKISPKTGLGMHIHPKRTDVYEEAEACIHYNYGNKKKIKELMKRYEKEKVPSQYGLFEATVIAIDLKNPNAEKILENWWEEFFRTETYRDQLTFTYVLWKNKYQMQDIGILGENVAKNLVFRRLQHRKEKQRKKLEDSEIYKKSKKIYDTYFKPIHMLIRKIIYRGKRYQCNICNSKVRKMLDYRNKNEIFTKQKVIGAGYREHVKCPVCRAKDIERMEFFYIQQYTNMLTEKNTILYFFRKQIIK